MNPYFPNLLSPIQVGSVTLKNRICLAPMNLLERDPNGVFKARDIAFIERLARGGVALITIGESYVGRKNGAAGLALHINDPGAYNGLCDMADAVHRYGAKISIEMSHAGAFSRPEYNSGELPMGPSAYVTPLGVQVTEMNEEQMEEVANEFGDAALTLKNAGFDLVMFHAAHGWLIHQFLSPRTNKRTDKYGGSVENRIRFPIMCLENIRKNVGKAFPIDMRITGDEVIEGGYGIDESKKFIKYLAPYVDMIQCSTGGIYHPDAAARMSPVVFYEKGCNVPFATAIKESINIPVSCVGGINEPLQMEEIIRDNRADLIVMGRGLICEPDLPKKLAVNDIENINRCLRCNECHNRFFAQGWFTCTINPTVGHEIDHVRTDNTPRVAKKVLVAGGGPGGMMAALTAARCGHEVTLCEKETALGGAIRFSDHVDFKIDMAYWRRQIEGKLAKTNINVLLNTSVNHEYVNNFAPDVLIIAVGADPVIPPIPGIDNSKVILGAKMHDRCLEFGKDVIVIGGGMVGCESAVELKNRGCSVTVVEMLPRIANGCGEAQANSIRVGLLGVKTLVNTRCLRVTNKGVRVKTDGHDEILLPADSIVLSTGMSARSKLVEDLQQAHVPETYVIGDSMAARKMGNAIKEGYYTAMNL
ncbi:MAG: NAD(P)/FAD-dependent oxidoreductase [Treponema sp.]|jgi:2,4-dienoyl-CoA reductase-like NADH-dependent reductase (Old Yellow Enzyme family)/thioredoxin reductase|nr:NAD(P)/FAD-dependent oxidoreductase [Treponema sp.]